MHSNGSELTHFIAVETHGVLCTLETTVSPFLASPWPPSLIACPMFTVCLSGGIISYHVNPSAPTLGMSAPLGIPHTKLGCVSVDRSESDGEGLQPEVPG